MPIYEYLCEDCGEKFSELRPVSEHKEPLEVECSKNDRRVPRKTCTAKRVMSPTPTTFRFADTGKDPWA